MSQRRAADHEQAWERYMEAERHELQMRREGHLRRLLGGPFAGESSKELERLASEDEARAEEGLVELPSVAGEVYYKHIDDFSPGDRRDRIAAEGAWIEWITERNRTRDSL